MKEKTELKAERENDYPHLRRVYTRHVYVR